MRHKVCIMLSSKWTIWPGAPCRLVELLQSLRNTKTQASVNIVSIIFVLTARSEFMLARGALSTELIFYPSTGIRCVRSLNKTNLWRKDSTVSTSKIAPSHAQTRNVELQSLWNRVDAAKSNAHSAISTSAGFAVNKPKVTSISKRIQITGVMKDTYNRLM